MKIKKLLNKPYFFMALAWIALAIAAMQLPSFGQTLKADKIPAGFKTVKPMQNGGKISRVKSDTTETGVEQLVDSTSESQGVVTTTYSVNTRTGVRTETGSTSTAPTATPNVAPNGTEQRRRVPGSRQPIASTTSDDDMLGQTRQVANAPATETIRRPVSRQVSQTQAGQWGDDIIVNSENVGQRAGYTQRGDGRYIYQQGNPSQGEQAGPSGKQIAGLLALQVGMQAAQVFLGSRYGGIGNGLPYMIGGILGGGQQGYGVGQQGYGQTMPDMGIWLSLNRPFDEGSNSALDWHYARARDHVFAGEWQRENCFNRVRVQQMDAFDAGVCQPAWARKNVELQQLGVQAYPGYGVGAGVVASGGHGAGDGHVH